MQAPLRSISPLTPTSAPLPFETAGPSSSLTWYQPLTERRSCFEQRLKIVDEPSGEGVGHHGHAHRTHNGSRRGDAWFREEHLAHRDGPTDLDHLILLCISTTALPLSHPSPTAQVDQVDVVDLFLVNA